MSDLAGAFAPLGGLLVYSLLFYNVHRVMHPRTPPRPPIITPPPGASSPVSPVLPVPESPATLKRGWPIPDSHRLVVPVERWTDGGELLAWRIWKLGRLPADGGVRLLSFGAPWAWDGPALRAHRLPTESPFSRNGIYGLKAAPLHSLSEDGYPLCWVTGWVALSGRVVEHEVGYRAERAVIRRLRLGIGTHLRVPRLEHLRSLAAELERRYQAPVNVGMAERRWAARVRRAHPERWEPGIPVIPAGVRLGW